MDWMPRINLKRCTGCGACCAVCPADALELGTGRAVVVHPAQCTYCGACEALCPAGAIALPYLIRFDRPSPDPTSSHHHTKSGSS